MSARAKETNLAALHIEMVRKELHKRGGLLPLRPCRDARHRWAQLGMTLTQRNNAAQRLVQYGEAVYADRRYYTLGGSGGSAAERAR
jgi:hypothetical protein